MNKVFCAAESRQESLAESPQSCAKSQKNSRKNLHLDSCKKNPESTHAESSMDSRAPESTLKSHVTSKPAESRTLKSSCKYSNSSSSKSAHNLNVSVLSSSFLSSASSARNAPAMLYTEVAILGRSNVGKSTLINLLLNNKNLAKSSSTPGKTRLINFFLSSWKAVRNAKTSHDGSVQNPPQIHSQNIQQNPPQDAPLETIYDIRFIDFPGFGYAKVSKAEKAAWDKNLSAFLAHRDSIKLFIHLVDSRHTNLERDDEIHTFLTNIIQDKNVILKVFTKSDKLNSNTKAKLKGNILVSHSDKQSIALLRARIIEHLFGV